MSKTLNQSIGQIGENLAVKYLEGKGLKILFRNYRRRLGEIDIVAQEGDEIVFVEVKARKKFFGNLYGMPEDAVDKKKIKKIKNTAWNFLERYKYSLNDTKWRIDIVSIELNWKTRMAKVKHIRYIH